MNEKINRINIQYHKKKKELENLKSGVDYRYALGILDKEQAKTQINKIEYQLATLEQKYKEAING